MGGIERNFDTRFVSALALREKQIQQNYRPVIAVHKWFARRPGTLFRALLLSEFVDRPVAESFYAAQDLKDVRVADPFMGGGTPLVEANRAGCDVIGFDINPMAYWVVREEIEHLDLAAYRDTAAELLAALRREIGESYVTRCGTCEGAADVKYFLWVKQVTCPTCDEPVDLFPGYRIAKNQRHPAHVILCHGCGEVNQAAEIGELGDCCSCSIALTLDGNARRGIARCASCSAEVEYPRATDPPRHKMVAIEYHCASCKPRRPGRFFKRPDDADLARYELAQARLRNMRLRYVPSDELAPGDETNRPIRWGYRKYSDMFNARQLRGLELSARYIADLGDERLRNAFATNLSDLLRYQNMLCRYDTTTLKSLDIFSIHGYPVSLIQCESNLLGIANGNGTNVGSGGWTNVIAKYAKAKQYCERPFEFKTEGKRAYRVPIDAEWIGETRPGRRGRKVEIRCEDAAATKLPAASLDAVLTDPPYFGNVQYGELMEFCYVWIKRLVGDDSNMKVTSVRHPDELTGNVTMDRGLEHFAAGISQTCQHMARALKPGAPLAFTYHHNDLDAYVPIAVAILDAGLVCTVPLACPAEMSGSIHINGTGSSVVDTIFVCRRQPVKVPAPPSDADGIAEHAHVLLRELAAAGRAPTPGDIQCVVFGYLTWLAISQLSESWDREQPISQRMDRVRENLEVGPKPSAVSAAIRSIGAPKVAAESSLLGDLPKERSKIAASV